MNYKVKTIPYFEREAKPLIKKYKSLKTEIKELSDSLQENPEQGTPIGNGFYKIRLAVASKGKGKSGGTRIITCVKIVKNTVFLASIYDKSEQENISDKELSLILIEIPN